MHRKRESAQELTDEQVLKEFVRRFQCDGAVLIYLDSSTEFGFGRWCNTKGQYWVDGLFKKFKQPTQLSINDVEIEGGTVVNLSVYK